MNPVYNRTKYASNDVDSGFSQDPGPGKFGGKAVQAAIVLSRTSIKRFFFYIGGYILTHRDVRWTTFDNGGYAPIRATQKKFFNSIVTGTSLALQVHFQNTGNWNSVLVTPEKADMVNSKIRGKQ
jgi:hypothetical protein